MKANRKFLNEEEAVSPVIAVILMVAITVVLAATVFVLVNDLGKNVGSSGPALGLVSDAAGSSTSQWTIKVSSATKLADLTDYRFVFATPDHGTMVISPHTATFTSGLDYYSDREPTFTTRDAIDSDNTTAPAGSATYEGYHFAFTDIDGNGKWSVGDTLVIKHDDDSDSDATHTNTFPSGEYTLEILHTPSGSSSGSLPRTF